MGCHSLLHGIFPTQGSNPGLPYCKQIFTIWATRLIDGIGHLHFRRGISPTSDSFSCFCFSKRPKFSSTLFYPGTEMARMQIELQWLSQLECCSFHFTIFINWEIDDTTTFPIKPNQTKKLSLVRPFSIYFLFQFFIASYKLDSASPWQNDTNILGPGDLSWQSMRSPEYSLPKQ